jgi:hypothetical protein
VNDAAPSGPAVEPAALAIPSLPVAPMPVADISAEMPASLPRDHPAWQRDMLAVSARVRAVLAQLRPVAIRALSFWDHAVRAVTVGSGRRLEVDPSGCYRLHEGTGECLRRSA